MSIEIDNLRASYDGRPVLHGISLTLPDGAFLSIVGPNGAGKTTLLKCLNRIHTEYQGTIRIDGEETSTLPQRELARRLGYVPQLQGELPGFQVMDFLLMSRYPHLSPFSTPTSRDFEAAEQALDATGMRAYAHARIDALSGGERQKILLSAALVQESRALLLDEPATFLDPRYQYEVHRLLKERHQAGATVVMVSHDINASIRLASQVLALRQGRVAFLGPVAELHLPGRLEAIFDTAFVYAPHPRDGQPQVVPE